MKKTVVSNPYLSGFGSAIKNLSRITLAIHILIATSFYYVMASGWLNSNGFTSTFWTVATIASCFILTTLISTAGIKTPASYLFFEMFASKTGRTQSENGATKTVFSAVAICCVACFLSIEVYSAFNGGAITAELITPKVESLSTSVLQVDEKRNASLAQYNAKVLDLEAKIDEAVNLAAGSELIRLSKNGNTWAKSEIAKKRKEVEIQYRKELNAAKSELSKQTASWDKTMATVTNTDSKKIESQLKSKELRESTFGTVFKILGVACLFISLICQYAISANDVARQLPALTQEELESLNINRSKNRKPSFTSRLSGFASGFGKSNSYSSAKGTF